MIRRAIDWADVHRRLEKSQMVLAGSAEQSPEQVGWILAERTRRMAAAVVDRSAERMVTLLSCRIGAERYALALDAVAEVAPFGKLTLPPRASSALLGAMNVRGVVHRVFDLGRLMALVGPGTPGGHIVILRGQDFPTGLRVDQAEAIVALSAGRLQGATAAQQNRFTSTVVDGLLVVDLEKIVAQIAGQRT